MQKSRNHKIELLIRNFLKKWATAVLLLVLFSVFSGCQKGSQVGEEKPALETDDLPSSSFELPPSWYNLETGKSALMGKSIDSSNDSDDSERDQSQSLAKGVARLLRVQRSSLDKLNETNGSDLMASGKPKDWVPWRLVSVIGELGLSAKGVLGVLGVKGSTGVEVYWEKKSGKTPQQVEPEGAVSKDEFGVVLDSSMSLAQIQKELKPLIEGIMATGRISNRELLKENLTQTAIEYQSTMNALMAVPLQTWYVSRLRLDLSISGSGTVSNGITAGAAIRARLEWHRIQQKKVNFVQPLAMSEKYKNLLDLISGVAADLSAVAEGDDVIGSAFKARQFRVGLGLTVGGSFAIIKGEASVVGHVYFTRGEKRPLSLAPTTSSLALLVDNPGALLGANSEGASIAKQFDLNNDGIIDQVIYKIDHQKFQKGLAFANKLGAFFGKQANEKNDQKWGVKQIKTSFDMGIGGELGLVTVTGSIVSQMEFVNTKF